MCFPDLVERKGRVGNEIQVTSPEESHYFLRLLSLGLISISTSCMFFLLFFIMQLCRVLSKLHRYATLQHLSCAAAASIKLLERAADKNRRNLVKLFPCRFQVSLSCLCMCVQSTRDKVEKESKVLGAFTDAVYYVSFPSLVRISHCCVHRLHIWMATMFWHGSTSAPWPTRYVVCKFSRDYGLRCVSID